MVRQWHRVPVRLYNVELDPVEQVDWAKDEEDRVRRMTDRGDDPYVSVRRGDEREVASPWNIIRYPGDMLQETAG